MNGCSSFTKKLSTFPLNKILLILVTYLGCNNPICSTALTLLFTSSRLLSDQSSNNLRISLLLDTVLVYFFFSSLVRTLRCLEKYFPPKIFRISNVDSNALLGLLNKGLYCGLDSTVAPYIEYFWPFFLFWYFGCKKAKFWLGLNLILSNFSINFCRSSSFIINLLFLPTSITYFSLFSISNKRVCLFFLLSGK